MVQALQTSLSDDDREWRSSGSTVAPSTRTAQQPVPLTDCVIFIILFRASHCVDLLGPAAIERSAFLPRRLQGISLATSFVVPCHGPPHHFWTGWWKPRQRQFHNNPDMSEVHHHLTSWNPPSPSYINTAAVRVQGGGGGVETDKEE